MTDLVSQGGFVLRTPALPLDAWLAGDPAALLERPDVRDALAVGAPGLLAALDRGRRGARELAALGRVVARMAARPTPFGLFAGWSTGRVGTTTALALPDAARPVSRVDPGMVATLGAHLAADHEVRRRATWWPNAGLWACAGRLRLVERRADGAGLVALEADDDLRAVLAAAASGAGWDALVGAVLARRPPATPADGPTRADADAYLHDLVDAQVLVTDVVPPVAGPPAGPWLARRARELGSPLAGALDAALDDLAAADAAPPGARAAHLARAADRLPATGAGPAPAARVQVDLHRPAPGLRLGRGVLEDLRRGVELLRRLGVREDDPLAAFRARFRERHDTRAVPLTEALDPDEGLDPGSPEPAAAPAAPAADRVRLDLLLDAARTGAREVELDPARVAGLPAAPLPGAFAVLASLSRDAVRVHAVTGPPGAGLLARFCHADPELERLVRDHLAAEAEREGDAVLAEIVHLPEPRLGAVLARPRLRACVLVLDGPRTGRDLVPDELTLRLRDDDRFELWSPRLGRRVLPRLTTAHDPAVGGLGLYRFLAALARDGVAGGLAWTWGALAPDATPRVRCGRVVLTPARWALGADDLSVLDAGDAGAVGAWRERRGLPRLVGLDAADAPLPADLATPAGVALVARERPAALVEWWPAPEDLPVRGPGGRYVHELVVPFTRPPDPAPPAAPRPPAPAGVRRRFPPGSEWLYAKLYAGPAAHDRLLVDELAPLAARLPLQAWHVIRFADPDPHLRVRLRADPDVLRDAARPALEAIGAGCRRLVLDTYEPELERFGGPDGMRACEALFTLDTQRVCALLAAEPPGEQAARRRWGTGAVSALTLLLDLGLDPEPAAAVLRRACGALGPGARRAAAADLRARRAELEPRIAAVLERRDPRVAAAAAGIDAVALAADLLHLHLNRLLRAPAGDQERRACDAAERLLAAHRARAGRAPA